MYEANANFSHQLLLWYNAFYRQLPWRETREPYAIWLSEIILQQTRVEQGTKYYFAFLENYPTILDLADASQDDVLRLWQGLGYYSRARNLHAAAKLVRDNFDGVFPSNYKDILMLPGVGPYTAAAIASFAFNIPEAAVDGNVYRFLSRFFGIQTPIDSPKGQKEFKVLAQSLISQKNPGNFNQAMIEFGAIVCKPVNPTCSICVFRDQCYAYKHQIIKEFPVKSKKTKVRNRFFVFLIFTDKEGQTLIQKRADTDIWAGLYQFPILEFEQPFSDFTSKNLQLAHPFFGSEHFKIQQISAEIRHILSHQRLFTHFIHIHVEKLPSEFFIKSEICFMIQLHLKAFPRLITRYLEGFL